MIIATWNVNSVRARLDRLLLWLERRRPDIVCLQELKTPEASFPLAAVERCGYRTAVFGQKGYHGVAILARGELRDVRNGVETGLDTEQARLLAATAGGIRVVSAYAPNGGTPDSPKYAYKREWLRRLETYLRAEADPGVPFILGGDLNIAPEQRDVGRPERWRGSVLYNEEMTTAFRQLTACGLADLGREHLPSGTFSWWDYRLLSFPRNDGLRLDHLLATPALAARCREVWVDRDERKGESPSDHAPVVAVFT